MLTLALTFWWCYGLSIFLYKCYKENHQIVVIDAIVALFVAPVVAFFSVLDMQFSIAYSVNYQIVSLRKNLNINPSCNPLMFNICRNNKYVAG